MTPINRFGTISTHLLAFLALFILSASLSAQTLRGRVLDESGNPIPAASVMIHALERSAQTDEAGRFAFAGVPRGEYVIETVHLGYRESAQRVIVGSGETEVDMILATTPLEMPALTVTAEAEPTSIRESTLPAAVLEGEKLRRARGQSVGETMESMPGISGFSGSPLAVKPVIRGLSAQRALVLSDGVRIESQTWDEPQSPEIDALDLERIEVVRGAGSVLYGSDALGGVVNAIRADLPSVERGDPALGAAILLNGFSNSAQGAGGISFGGASGVYGYRGNFSIRSASDYSAPAGTTAAGTRRDAGKVFNSGALEIDGSLRAGMRREWGTLTFDASHFGQTYYIAPEPGRKEYELNINTGLYDSLPAAPKQEILHEKGALFAQLPVSFGRLELEAAYQRNSRREEGVSESDADEKKKEALGIKPEAQLVLNSVSLDARAHHNPAGLLTGTAGVSGVYQSNSTEGQKAIIPAYTSWNVAGFLYESLRLAESLRGTGGIRFDSRGLKAEANTQLGNPTTTLNFSALTGSAGFAWELTGDLVLALNAGRGWRAPVAAELFFKGADEGAVRYKLGDATLKPEESFSLDGSLRYSAPFLTAELSLFRNRIGRYIYPAPTTQVIDGLQVYAYRQSDATLAGGEFSLQARLASWLIAGGGFDMVRGTNDATGAPLPFIPADRITAQVRCLAEELLILKNAAFSLRARLYRRQDRIDLLETETPPYTLIDASLGGEVAIAGARCMIDLAVDNLLNRAYFDHLSRYKNYALNPGRNIVLRAEVPVKILE